MIDLKPFKKANLRLLIGEEASRLNNFIDCDVIQEAKMQVENATTDQETLNAIAYLLISVKYRGGSTKLIEQYKAEYQNEPISGKVYSLTNGHDQPSISAGNTWAESEIPRP